MIDTMTIDEKTQRDVKQIDTITLLLNKVERALTDATLDYASRRLKDLHELVEIRRRKKAKRGR